jgi:hypothetical protein
VPATERNKDIQMVLFNCRSSKIMRDKSAIERGERGEEG